MKKVKISEKAVNYLLIFILGFLVGVAVKTEAKRRITIGYGDYLILGMKQDFDLTKAKPTVTPEDQSAPAETESPAPIDSEKQ